MVLLMAYSNFQDRLLLCLGSPLEAGGPQPPIDVVFAPEAVETKMPRPLPAQMSPLPKPTGKDLVEDDPDWASLSFDELQRGWKTRSASRPGCPSPMGGRRARPAAGLHAAQPHRLEPGLPWATSLSWRPRGRP